MSDVLNPYWNLSLKERATLTSEEFAEYERFELMVRGVEKPKPMIDVTEDEITVDIDAESFFAIRVQRSRLPTCSS
jgi:hypothetical protein